MNLELDFRRHVAGDVGQRVELGQHEHSFPIRRAKTKKNRSKEPRGSERPTAAATKKKNVCVRVRGRRQRSTLRRHTKCGDPLIRTVEKKQHKNNNSNKDPERGKCKSPFRASEAQSRDREARALICKQTRWIWRRASSASVRHRPARGNGGGLCGSSSQDLVVTGGLLRHYVSPPLPPETANGEARQPNQNKKPSASNRLGGTAQTQTWRETKNRARKRKKGGGGGGLK